MRKFHKKSISHFKKNQVLTDQELAKLFLSLYPHYKDAKHKKPNQAQAIYDDLQLSMYWEFEFGSLKRYKENILAQQEAYKILNLFWLAHQKEWQNISLTQFVPSYQFPAQFTTFIIDNDYSSRRHYCHNNFSDLLFISLCMSSGPRSYPASNSVATAGAIDDITKLATILLVLIAVIAVCVAIYFIVKYLTDSVERLTYHEGFFDALAPMTGMLVGGAIAGVTSTFLLTGPLITLAITASTVPPIGFAIGIVVAISLAAAAFGGVIAKHSKEYANKKLHTDSLNPHDPHRFCLTASEAQHLEEINLDPIKVKCAMVALMRTIKKEKVPHLFSRNTKTQDTLDKVRKLRAGKIDHLDVEGLSFNLQINNQHDAHYTEQEACNPDDNSIINAGSICACNY